MPSNDFDLDDEFLGPASEWIDRAVLRHSTPTHRSARRELRWFYVRMHGRVPAVVAAPSDEVAAASRIAGWLSELDPAQRGAFVLRYHPRRWPVRLLRQFGGLTSTVVRLGANQCSRGANETLADVERAVVGALLADIAAARRPQDRTAGPSRRPLPEEKLRRVRRGALAHVRRAEHAYVQARGQGRCVVPEGK